MFMWNEPFMIRALLVGVALGLSASFLGVFATARRMAFLSDTVAHGSLLGVAAGLSLGLSDLTWPILLISLLLGFGILWLKEKVQVMTDNAMAMIFAGSVALAILVLNWKRISPAVAHGYLFGDILSVTRSDVIWSIVASAVILGIGLRYLNAWILITLNEDLAWVSGISVRFWNYVFMAALAVVIALGVQMLGVILMTATVVAPPLTAQALSGGLKGQIRWALIFGAGSALLGLTASYYLNLPCGPALALTHCFVFLLVTTVQVFRNNKSIRQ